MNELDEALYQYNLAYKQHVILTTGRDSERALLEAKFLGPQPAIEASVKELAVDLSKRAASASAKALQKSYKRLSQLAKAGMESNAFKSETLSKNLDKFKPTAVKGKTYPSDHAHEFFSKSDTIKLSDVKSTIEHMVKDTIADLKAIDGFVKLIDAEPTNILKTLESKLSERGFKHLTRETTSKAPVIWRLSNASNTNMLVKSVGKTNRMVTIDLVKAKSGEVKLAGKAKNVEMDIDPNGLVKLLKSASKSIIKQRRDFRTVLRFIERQTDIVTQEDISKKDTLAYKALFISYIDLHTVLVSASLNRLEMLIKIVKGV